MGRVRAGWLLLIMLAVALGGSAGAIGSVHAAGTTYYVGRQDDTAGSVANCANPSNTDCRLRDAIAAATSGADTIVFNSGVFNTTLQNGTLSLTHNVTIKAPMASQFSINANFYAGFTVNSGVTAAISGVTVLFANHAVVNNGTLTLTNSNIGDSIGGDSGGGIDNGGTLTLTGSVIFMNTAPIGGGIHNSGTATITNSTIANNFAQAGIAGGILNDGTLTVTNSTIAGNTASAAPYGLYNTGTAKLTNTIVAGNGDPDFGGASLATDSHNLIGGTPNLGQLGDNGGSTPTMPLQAGSPAIGGGDPAVCAASPVGGVDQRGVSRPASSCDIGAYQSQGLAAPPALSASAAWIIGTTAQSGGYDIAQFSSGVWSAVSGAAVRIAVGPDGQPWVVNSNGSIFHRVNGAWQSLPGAARAIAVGADGSVWVLSPSTTTVPGDTTIYHWNGSGWDRADGSASEIAVGPDGQPWVVNSNGSIYHRVNGAWQVLPGTASAIAVGADGSVWVLGSTMTAANYGIYRWNGSGWDQIDGGGVRIAVGSDGQPWVVNSNGAIYHRVNGAWQTLPGAANDIGVH